MSNELPFYGSNIICRNEEAYIQSLLAKHRGKPATDALKKEIWDELQMEKYYGRVTVPFKVVLHRDVYGKFPDFIEILLDTKV